MNNECTGDLEDLERLSLTFPDKPMRCDMCVNESDLGIQYKTKLGRIALCTDCLTVIEIVANKIGDSE